MRMVTSEHVKMRIPKTRKRKPGAKIGVSPIVLPIVPPSPVPTENVVNPVVPDAVHDKVQLDEDGTEGKDATHEHGRHGLQVVGLLGDLAGNLVGLDGVLKPLGLETKVGADHAERRRDQEPHADESDHRSEGDGARGMGADEKEVEEDEDHENEAVRNRKSVTVLLPAGDVDSPRHQEGRKDDVQLPVLSAKHFVQASRDVASKRAEANVKDKHDGR